MVVNSVFIMYKQDQMIFTVHEWERMVFTVDEWEWMILQCAPFWSFMIILWEMTKNEREISFMTVRNGNAGSHLSFTNDH